MLGREIRNSFLNYQRYDVDKGTESTQPRVRLSLADDESFQDLLAGASVGPVRESHHLLQQSATLLREELVLPATADPGPMKARGRLQRLRDAVLTDRSGVLRCLSVLPAASSADLLQPRPVTGSVRLRSLMGEVTPTSSTRCATSLMQAGGGPAPIRTR